MLALAFHEPKISKLKQKLTEGEFLEWKTFYEIRPFGDEWEDMRIAWLNFHIPHFGGSSGKTAEEMLAEMMPPIEGRPAREMRVQSAEEQTAILRRKFPR